MVATSKFNRCVAVTKRVCSLNGQAFKRLSSARSTGRVWESTPEPVEKVKFIHHVPHS
jgi:hypothetical protein